MPGVGPDLLRALAVLAERPGHGDGPARIAAALDLAPVPDDVSWTQVFVFNLYPHASVYLGPEGQVGGEAADRVAGFFRALDAVPPRDVDAVPTLLAAWAELRDRAAGDDPRAARAEATLVHEHLRSWLPLVLGRMVTLAPAPWPDWARLVLAALRGGTTDGPDLPLHLREAPTFTDPRVADTGGDGGESLVDQLLVPVRCGFVLTTTDLRRCAHETGLGLRLAERRYVLGQLLGQDVATTLHWLADHGQSTTDAAWDGWDEVTEATAAWWRTRAAWTATLLRDLADDAAAAEVVVEG